MDEALGQLRDAVTKDGVIDEAEVAALKALVLKRGINDEALTVLLEINTALSGAQHPKSFEDFFVRSIFAYMLGTGDRVTEDRWDWLKANLLRDGVIDALERRLLVMIKQQARAYPPELDALLAG